MKNIITITLISIICLSASLCFAQEFEMGLITASTPQELAKWFSEEFKYQWEIIDKWNTPQETIDSKEGDCEDFAILASAVLWRMGIDNDILVIKFKDLDVAHCICVWEDENGMYNFMSNKELYNTGKNKIKAAIDKFFPDWEKVTFTDYQRKNVQVVRRTEKI